MSRERIVKKWLSLSFEEQERWREKYKKEYGRHWAEDGAVNFYEWWEKYV